MQPAKALRGLSGALAGSWGRLKEHHIDAKTGRSPPNSFDPIPKLYQKTPLSNNKTLEQKNFIDDEADLEDFEKAEKDRAKMGLSC